MTGGAIGYTSATLLPGTTIAGSDDAAAWPASRLRDGRPASKCRTAGVGGAKTWTITTLQPLPVLAYNIEGHNFTSAATITITAGGAAPEAVTWAAGRIVGLLAYVREGTSIVLSVTDAANGDGYLELGAFHCWATFDPVVKADVEMAHTFHDPSTAVESIHRARTVRSRTQYERRTWSWSHLPRARAMAMQDVCSVLARNGRGLVIGDVVNGLAERATYGVIESAASHVLSGPADTRRDVVGVTVREEL